MHGKLMHGKLRGKAFNHQRADSNSRRTFHYRTHNEASSYKQPKPQEARKAFLEKNGKKNTHTATVIPCFVFICP